MKKSDIMLQGYYMYLIDYFDEHPFAGCDEPQSLCDYLTSNR
jgi:hypothetical protein